MDQNVLQRQNYITVTQILCFQKSIR